MSPDELFQKAGAVLQECNSDGIPPEQAAVFIERVQTHIRHIALWIPPVYGEIGYADSQLIDMIRLLKFQSEGILAHFPTGVDALYAGLGTLRQYLQDSYAIRKTQ